MGDITTKPVSKPPVRPATPPPAEKKPEIRCFQDKGVYGSPRLVFLNKPFAGVGLKFGASVQYRSVWQKGENRLGGIGGAFELGISGINFLGSRRRKHALMLLSIHGGIGISTLTGERSVAEEQSFVEYSPRVGIDVHFVKFFSLSLFAKGGYIFSMMKNNKGGKFENRHGGYAGLGAEFDVSFLSRAFSPFITVTYTGYEGGRHDLTAGAGLRY